MARQPPEESKDEHVPSYLAHPSRPRGEAGIHQPVQPSSPVPPPASAPSDDELARRLREVLQADGRVDTQDIAVTVLDGVAHLDGSVALEFQRSLAVALINSVPGVLTVKNRLSVRSG